jgi:hypothetical protein
MGSLALAQETGGGGLAAVRVERADGRPADAPAHHASMDTER